MSNAVELNNSARLNNTDLVDMRAACIATADMIEAHLIGRGDEGGATNRKQVHKPPSGGTAMTTLNAARLSELRQTLIEYRDCHAYTDAFRSRCEECADLIARYLSGEGVAVETAAAIEEVFGPLARAEGDRIQALNARDLQMTLATIDDDPLAWRAAMLRALPLMTEAQVRGLMDVINDDGKVEPPFNIATLPWVHDAPTAVQ
ncbi:MAG: hypothetical protein QG662_2071 [Pseudomonadota bacterium]|nr:hypothetical protein [Pseudomonadota bacterium]